LLALGLDDTEELSFSAVITTFSFGLDSQPGAFAPHAS
jgi:hypothetical protein